MTQSKFLKISGCFGGENKVGMKMVGVKSRGKTSEGYVMDEP